MAGHSRAIRPSSGSTSCLAVVDMGRDVPRLRRAADPRLVASSRRSGQHRARDRRYVGYGGGRGLPFEWLTWAAAGYAHLVMDTRGQGWGWWPVIRQTSDPTAARLPGVHDPRDPRPWDVLLPPGVRRWRPRDRGCRSTAVDPDRIVVTGKSQGGGMALAVASLAPDVAAGMPMCRSCPTSHGPSRSRTRPVREIRRYLSARRELRTRPSNPRLRRRPRSSTRARPGAVLCRADGRGQPAIDGLRRVQRIRRAEGDLEYPFNDHEGGAAFHDIAKIRWLADRFGRPVQRGE